MEEEIEAQRSWANDETKLTFIALDVDAAGDARRDGDGDGDGAGEDEAREDVDGRGDARSPADPRAREARERPDDRGDVLRAAASTRVHAARVGGAMPARGGDSGDGEGEGGDGDGDGGDGGEEEVAEDNKNASAPLKKKKTNAADELAWPSLRAPWDESSAPGEKHDLQSEILLRRDAAVARCDEWARYARHLREHVESLSPDTRSERRAIVDGAKAIDALVKRCGGRVVFESPREIEKLAQVRSIHWFPYDRVGDVDADP